MHEWCTCDSDAPDGTKAFKSAHSLGMRDQVQRAGCEAQVGACTRGVLCIDEPTLTYISANQGHLQQFICNGVQKPCPLSHNQFTITTNHVFMRIVIWLICIVFVDICKFPHPQTWVPYTRHKTSNLVRTTLYENERCITLSFIISRLSVCVLFCVFSVVRIGRLLRVLVYLVITLLRNLSLLGGDRSFIVPTSSSKSVHSRLRTMPSTRTTVAPLPLNMAAAQHPTSSSVDVAPSAAA